MSNIVETLVEMGFDKARAELAISETNAKEVETAMEWLLTHEEQESSISSENVAISADNGDATDNVQNSEATTSQTPLTAKSIKCDDCGKLFKTNEEVEFHAAKSGHGNYSESTEEKKPLTDEEKKQQLAKIEEKLKQRRLEREAKEKQEELDREKNRIRSGKDLLEAKRKQEEVEMKKLMDQRKREKQEERMARERVRQQIEQDKLARKAKQQQQPVETAAPASPPAAKPPAQQSYSEVKLQIRLTNGSTLTQTFGPKEPLSAVRVFVEMNRTDGNGPFSLMTTFPRKVFGVEDYEKPLEVLGLAPSAVLIVSKT